MSSSTPAASSLTRTRRVRVEPGTAPRFERVRKTGAVAMRQGGVHLSGRHSTRVLRRAIQQLDRRLHTIGRRRQESLGMGSWLVT